MYIQEDVGAYIRCVNVSLGILIYRPKGNYMEISVTVI